LQKSLLTSFQWHDFFGACAMMLGAHVSIAGGYENALKEAQRLGMDAIQIFTKNQRSWQERLLGDEEGKPFRLGLKKHGVKQAFSHAIYLISLGSDKEEIVEKSVLSLAAELARCRALGLTHTVLHPGHAGGTGIDEALVRIGTHIERVLQATQNNPVKILLENTAGSGSSVGGKLEYLAALISQLDSPRLGFCIDTCHAFASGYDIRTARGCDKFFSEADRRIGLDKLLCFHLNDSKGALASRLDRHAHIGEGLIGLTAFEYVMKNFRQVPKVIETPKENEADRRNLDLLRKLATKK
jgi:deoxyribonuclease IV